MNKGLFSGWKDVFSFTFKQGVSGKGFKAVTLGLAVGLLVVGMAISIIMAFVQKKEATEVSPIEKVYVIDESGLELLYLDGFAESFGEEYPNLSFVTDFDSKQETAEANLENTSETKKRTVQEANLAILQEMMGEEPHDSDISGQYDVILHIGKADEGYLMTLYIPELSLMEEEDGEDFLADVTIVMEQSKLISSGISMDKLVLAMSGVDSTILNAGEQEKSIGEHLVAMLLPMLLMFFMYMMNLVYGQSIGNTVSVEKTSKLMEMILTLTRPYGLIFGKIFAMTSIAIMQMVLWLGCLVGGFFVGDMLAKQLVYAAYNNVILEVFELLGSQNGSTAFSVGAVLLAVFTICLSFLFYCVLAGMIASFATKAEDLAQVMSYYQLTMIAGFFGSYMLPLQEKEWINTILRIVPITSAYLLPGDIIVGNITVWMGLLYVAILLACTLVLVVVAGKVYKNQLFYKGSSWKDRFKRKKKG